MATTVRRRLIFVKKTKNPHAPLPRRRTSADDTMVGEKAKSVVPLVAPASVRAAPSRRAKLVRRMALLGGMACIGAAIAAVGQMGFGSGKSHAEVEARPPVSRVTPIRVQTPVTSAELQGEPLHSLMAQRADPTDESFRAAAYARRR